MQGSTNSNFNIYIKKTYKKLRNNSSTLHSGGIVIDKMIWVLTKINDKLPNKYLKILFELGLKVYNVAVVYFDWLKWKVTFIVLYLKNAFKITIAKLT